MNRREVLTELDSMPGSKSFTQALDWVRKQKTGSKSVGLVLSRLIFYPDLDEHLDWLTSWSKSANWEFLISSLNDDAFSPIVRDRILSIVRCNLDHPECGKFFRSYLQTFRDDEVYELAEKWLVTYSTQTPDAKYIVARLLRRKQTHELVLIAERTELTRHVVFEDFQVLCALLEKTDSTSAEEAGLRLLSNNKFGLASSIAAALLSRDSKYQVQVKIAFEQLVGKAKSSMLAHDLAKTKAGRQLVFAFINQTTDGSTVRDLLSGLICAPDPPREIVEFACQWYADRYDDVDEDVTFLLSLLESGIEVPDVIVGKVFCWLEAHIENPFWIQVALAALMFSFSKRQKEITNMCLRQDLTPELQGEILASVLSKVVDSADVAFFLELALNWLKTFENKTQGMVFARVLQNTLIHTKDPALLKIANDLLSKADVEVTYVLLSALVKAGDTEAFPRARMLLLENKYHRNNSSSEHRLGSLLSAMLSTDSQDKLVRAHAASWLLENDDSRNRALRSVLEQRLV